MAKPTKPARAREGQSKCTPFTDDLKEAILAGFNAVPGGVLGFLDKVALENPRLAGRARRYAEYFATQGGTPEEARPRRTRLGPPRP
jgi:hypothetical protein